MLIERLFGWDPATCYGSPALSIHGKASVADPDTSAGDSDEDEETGLAASDEDIEALRGDDDDLDDDREEASGRESEAATAKRTHRFKDHDAAEQGFVELQSHKDRVEQENARLRAQLAEREMGSEQATRQPATFEMNEAQLAEIGQLVNDEYVKLPEKDRNLVSATRIMGKHMMQAMAKMSERIAGQTVTSATQMAQARADAETRCKAAMAEAGLDPEKHWDLLLLQRDHLNRQDPNYLRTLPPADQFKELATRTLGYLKELGLNTKADVKRANAEHNREAAATLTSTSRRPATRETRETDDDDDPKRDTMGADLNAHRAGLRARSRVAYNNLTGMRQLTGRR